MKIILQVSKIRVWKSSDKNGAKRRGNWRRSNCNNNNYDNNNNIQGVSWGIINILGGCSMDYCE